MANPTTNFKSIVASASQAAENAQIAAKVAGDLTTAVAILTTDTGWMKNSLAKIEEKLNTMDKAFVTAAQHIEVCNELEDHEKRIRGIETNILKWMGAISVVTSLLTIGVAIALKVIK